MRNPVVAIWVLGIVVALVAYQFGPNHLLATLADIIWRSTGLLEQWIFDLSHSAAEFVRAAAIGLYVVFVALSLLVIRQGGRAKGVLILVSLIFYLLVWSSEFSNARGFAAFVLSGVGALVMTRRLTGPDRHFPAP